MADEQVSDFTFLGHYAGFVTRLAAFAVDRIITSAIMSMIAVSAKFFWDAFRINRLLGFNVSWQVATGIGVGVFLVISILYDVGFWLLVGQTPGKRLMGVRVVRTDGARLRLGNALRRELGYVISGILFLGYVWIVFDNRRQGLHDKLAGTIVVYSWPEGELKGTFVRDRVQRMLQERQTVHAEEGSG